MALVIKDRVKEGTTTTGTGAVSLSGAAATFSPFNSHMTNGDTTYYAIVHTSSGVDEWEVGLGTWNTGNTLSRTTIYDGSNGTSAVNFSGGTKNIFMVSPADKTVLKDSAGDVTVDLTAIDDTVIGGTTPAAGSFTTLAASGNVDFDGYIDMNPISHPTHAEGRVYYDTTHKSLSYQSDISDVEHELGIEEHVRVYNNSGSTIPKGKPVYWSGNQNDVPTIGLANATSATKYNVQGLTAGSIANNSYGYVIVSGLVYDIDTSSLNAGDNFFAGLTDGALQNASPTYPNFPMCLGWVIKSDASTGIVLVNQQNHSVNSFRVRTDAHVGGDLTISGDLTVNGTQTATSSNNVSLGASFQYLNAGDTIGEANTSFTGSGLDDANLVGHFSGTASTTYYVRIDGTGTPDTFEWSKDNFATTQATGVAITGNDQTLDNGISVNFGTTTGHTSGDVWSGTAAPANVDTGLFTNYNTGGSGVGYTHTGIFWDASTSKWTVLSEYDPEPQGTINLADASVAYATFKAGTFEGDLTGDVTGDVTGTATSANALATARTIGGVSFDGSANINLPGVNTTGNQDTTGNAATATALETARTIQLSGDVTGSVSFDGTGNVNITTAVGDDSHNHIISNVDGLQTALDAKADDSTTFTAGNYLTGGGTLGANRTFDVDATPNNTASKVVARDTSGNFSAGTITANLSGNASTATSAAALTTARTIALTGDVSGSTSFDGSGNVSITATVADDSHNHVTSNIDGLAEFVSDTVGSMVTGNTESGISVTYDDADNTLDFNVNDPTISLTGAVTGSATMTNLGNVSIATTATSDPTLTLSGDVTGSATFTNLGNATLTATVANDSHTHDGRYYTETEADSRFVNVTGDTMTGNLSFGDNDKAIFGAGSDLEIYHDGSHSYIVDNGTGNLYAQADNYLVIRKNDASKTSAWFNTDGEVELRYNDSVKLATTSTGVDVTGNITVSGTVDGRDVATDGTKLDGIASGAQVNVPTNLGSGTAASSVSISSSTGSNTSISAATTSAAGVMSSADKTKLDGIESGATADQTITAGNGLSGGGTGDVTLNHADTSSQASVNNSNGTVIQDITLDTYGHITGLASVDLDGRYYTETESDTRYARKDTATRQDFTGSIRVSTNNSSGGGIVLADDGDIVDLNDGYASMRFSNGVRVYSGNGTGSVRHTLASDGNFTATGNVTAYSDISLKDNIETISGALDKVSALRGVTYNRIDLEDAPRHAGVIAQEVEEVLPEVVATDDEGIKHVAYGNMVGLLIEAIKEQQQQIDELKAKLGDK